MMLEYSVLSTEHVMVRVDADLNGIQIDPTTDAVELALMASGDPDTADWMTASWETDGSSARVKYFAKAQLSDFSPIAGTYYDVWVRVHDNPETVVENVGPIHVY